MNEFSELMRILHPPSTLDAVNVSNVRAILPLAHEFHITGILSRCREILHKEPPSEDIFYLSVTYGFPELEERCFDAFVKSLSIDEAKHKVRFQALPADKKQRYYEAKVATAEAEARQAEREAKLVKEVKRKSSIQDSAVGWDDILNGEGGDSNDVRERCEAAMLLQAPSMLSLYTADKHQLNKVIRHCEAYTNLHIMSEISTDELYSKISDHTWVQLLASKADFLERILTAVVASDRIPPYISVEGLLSGSTYASNYRRHCTSKSSRNGSTETDVKLYTKIVPKSLKIVKTV